jgi:hypothetical protein
MRYHASCKYEYAATHGGPLFLDRDDALAGGEGEVKGSVASGVKDVGTARKENVRGTLYT